MKDKFKKQYIEELNDLASILNKSSLVNSFDERDEKESYQLAISLLDIKESAKGIEERMSMLQQSMNVTAIDDILWDIGEELRHIIYHIVNSKFYNYLSTFEEEE